MTRRWLTRLIRRTVASAYLYGMLRSAALALQWVTRRPDEPDLRFLAKIPLRDDELVLDVGANGGQSAIALSFIRPRAKIISFEPISTLWPELDRVRWLLGSKFDYRKYGLGETAGTFSLYIPVSGELLITTRASVSKEAADQNCLELELTVGLPTRIQNIPVEVREGDAERLRPIAIKIDVEGTEDQVVQGLLQTIKDSRPVLLLERSTSFERCVEILAEQGYDILTASGGAPREKLLPGLSHRNWIACPPEITKHLLAD